MLVALVRPLFPVVTMCEFTLSPLCNLQFKIEPFKHPVKMDPKYGGMCRQQIIYNVGMLVIEVCSEPVCLFYAEKTWKVLADAIHEINNHNASGLSFEELYRCVVTSKRVSDHQP